MDEVLTGIFKSIAEQGLLFAVLVAILWGSYKGVWVWGTRLIEQRAEYEKLLSVAAERLEESKKDKQWWQTQATQALGIAEGTVQTVLKERRGAGSES